MSILQNIIIKALKYLPLTQLESIIYQLVSTRVAEIPPDESLRFLFRLDAALYILEGQKAIDYDGGVHSKHRIMRYHDFFVNNVRQEERVIDIGCGIGALAYDVAERSGASVVAIDLNPDNIAVAQRRYSHPRINYLVGNVMHDLPGDSYDVIILSNVLEHLPKRADFLRIIQEKVHPCRLLIRVPLFEREWRVPLKRELGVEWRLDTTHEIEYSIESFAEEMGAAGLRIMHQEVRWGEIWAVTVPNR